MSHVHPLLTAVVLIALLPFHAQGQWEVEYAGGHRAATSPFAVPTGAGVDGIAGSARIVALCEAPNHIVGVLLFSEISVRPGTMPARIHVDGQVEELDIIVNDNLLLIGSTESGLVQQIEQGSRLRLRIGRASSGFLTWEWSLRGSHSAIQRACR